MNKILIIILLAILLIAPSGTSVAAKPTRTPTPMPTPVPTSTPVPAPSFTSDGWIGSPQPQQIAAILPLVDHTAVAIVWDADQQTIHILGLDFSGAQATDQNWSVGFAPKAITIAACGRDLWLGVDGGITAHFELPAEVCACTATSTTYNPIYIPIAGVNP